MYFLGGASLVAPLFSGRRFGPKIIRKFDEISNPILERFFGDKVAPSAPKYSQKCSEWSPKSMKNRSPERFRGLWPTP